MAFRNYLEGEDDKPYFHLNSLGHYYEEMQRYAALIKEMTGYIKDYGNELGLTKEEIDQRVTAYILENKTQLDQRLGEWDGKLEGFDGSVMNLLTEWVNDGTMDHIIDTTIVDQKIVPVTDRLNRMVKNTIYTTDKKYGIVGDGVTDDTAGFQKVMDDALSTNQDIMLLGNILITDSIVINRDSGIRKIIQVKGQGELIKQTPGFMFTCTISDRNAGNIRFTGIKFRSIQGVGMIVVNAAKLIRMYFNECDFINVDSLIFIPDEEVFPNNYIQTVYLTDCTVVGGKGYFVKAPNMYDFTFTNSVMETRDGGFYCKVFNSVRIFNNVIEGMDGMVFLGSNGRNLDISNNYFEECAKSMPNKCFIEFTGTDPSGSSVSLKNNYMLGTVTQNTDADFYVVKFTTLFKNTRIGGNTASMNLYKVVNVYSITPEFLKVAFTENVEPDSKKTVNNMGSFEIITGGLSLIRDIQMPFDASRIGNVISKVADTAAHVNVTIDPGNPYLDLRVTTETTKAGFTVNKKMKLNTGINYVIGLQGMARLGDQPNAIINIVDSMGTVSWTTKMDFEKYIGARQLDNFYSLPPFKVTKNDEYVVQVMFDTPNGLIKAGSGLLIASLTVQTGTIANPMSQYKNDSSWNGEHVRMGTHSLWIDGSGRLRIKNGYPISDGDGVVVGMQV